jgi:hypothetical protein
VASDDFQVVGRNRNAPFTLKVHRGEGMALLAMNWKNGPPPNDFVGFAISYMEPGGDRFFVLQNRVGFAGAGGAVDPASRPTTLAPIQKFRWVHFPRNAELAGAFTYRVVPVFMNAADELSYGEAQKVRLELRRETYPKMLNVTFTRGFVSSQAFVDRYASKGPMSTLLPHEADAGLSFVPTHPKADEALAWMGFEARHAILELLDQAIADPDAEVEVVAYELSQPDVLSRLVKLGKRLRVIIDDDGPHKAPHSAETQAELRLVRSAGRENVKRQHMGKLQHNKTIVVDGPTTQAVVCGSTNFSWRGFFVQANNAVVLRGDRAVRAFRAGFEAYWSHDKAAGFGQTPVVQFTPLGLPGITASVAFSPRAKQDALLSSIGDDIATNTESSVFYAIAFLGQTKGAIREAITQVTADDDIFVYGMADKKIGGLELQKPNGNLVPVRPAALAKNVPEPFKSEPAGGGGNRLHHKFVVIDFDRPTARVYLGSFNFSPAADTSNGENLLLVADRRVAVAYMVEALRLFDHYHFRIKQQDAKTARKQLVLTKPPRRPTDVAWWEEAYTSPPKIRDRELFA